VKKLLALPLIASLSLPLIHALKLERIQHRCDSTRSRAADTFRPQEDDINDAIGKVNSLQYKSITDRGGLKFITGDFDEDDGRVRCGGVARIVSESLAEKGFDTRIYLEGYPDGTMHYYAIVRKSGNLGESTAPHQTYSHQRFLPGLTWMVVYRRGLRHLRREGDSD
jgi:hypothetical protein